MGLIILVLLHHGIYIFVDVHLELGDIQPAVDHVADFINLVYLVVVKI
jgi:hypothetical protein